MINLFFKAIEEIQFTYHKFSAATDWACSVTTVDKIKDTCARWHVDEITLDQAYKQLDLRDDKSSNKNLRRNRQTKVYIYCDFYRKAN